MARGTKQDTDVSCLLKPVDTIGKLYGPCAGSHKRHLDFIGLPPDVHNSYSFYSPFTPFTPSNPVPSPQKRTHTKTEAVN
jgi:hypothetical protein